MPKFYGEIGYAITAEQTPGVWVEAITTKQYYGDIIRNIRKLQSTEQLNDNINVSNEISIVADPFAMENFHLMRYVEYMGTKWKITSVDVKHPRLNMTIGGVYNEQET